MKTYLIPFPRAQQGNSHFPTALMQVFEKLSYLIEDGCKGFVAILSYATLGKTLHWALLSSLKTPWILPKTTVSSQSLSSTLTAPMNITWESELPSSRVFTYFFCPCESKGSFPLYSMDKTYLVCT